MSDANPTIDCGGAPVGVDFSACGEGTVLLPTTLRFSFMGQPLDNLTYADSMPDDVCLNGGFKGYSGWYVLSAGFSFWWGPGVAEPDSGSSNNVWNSYDAETCAVLDGEGAGSQCADMEFNPFRWVTTFFTIEE